MDVFAGAGKPISTVYHKPLPIMDSLHAVPNQTKLSEARKHWLVKINKLGSDLTPFQTNGNFSLLQILCPKH